MKRSNVKNPLCNFAKVPVYTRGQTVEPSWPQCTCRGSYIWNWSDQIASCVCLLETYRCTAIHCIQNEHPVHSSILILNQTSCACCKADIPWALTLWFSVSWSCSCRLRWRFHQGSTPRYPQRSEALDGLCQLYLCTSDGCQTRAGYSWQHTP